MDRFAPYTVRRAVDAFTFSLARRRTIVLLRFHCFSRMARSRRLMWASISRSVRTTSPVQIRKNVVDPVEELLEVQVHHPPEAFLQRPPHKRREAAMRNGEDPMKPAAPPGDERCRCRDRRSRAPCKARAHESSGSGSGSGRGRGRGPSTSRPLRGRYAQGERTGRSRDRDRGRGWARCEARAAPFRSARAAARSSGATRRSGIRSPCGRLRTPGARRRRPRRGAPPRSSARPSAG